MPTFTWLDPFEERENPNYEYDAVPEKIPVSVTNEEAIALWEDVMRRVKRKHTGRVVLETADTATQVLTRKIFSFLDDKEHIELKFNGVRPNYECIYRGAGLSKSTWDRLLSGKNSNISRGTVFAIAIGLRLDDMQTLELLFSAGFCLNYELDLDVAMMYFIKREIYDMKRIRRVLSSFSDVKNGLDRFYFQPPTNR